MALDVSEPTREQLIDYVMLLARWNRAYNLSAVREPREMVTRHLLDSLAVLPWVAPGSLLDVGTGPGLPGIPLAIARRGLAVTLLDSNGKKVRFLRQAVMTLDLDNCQVIQARAEDLDGRYTRVIARAFTDLPGFWRLAAPRLTADGRALAMKGRYPQAELSALAGMGVSWQIFPLQIPGLDAERHLVELRAEQ